MLTLVLLDFTFFKLFNGCFCGSEDYSQKMLPERGSPQKCKLEIVLGCTWTLGFSMFFNVFNLVRSVIQ